MFKFCFAPFCFSELIACDSNPCQQGLTCRVEVDDNKAYYCDCQPDVHGSNCGKKRFAFVLEFSHWCSEPVRYELHNLK